MVNHLGFPHRPNTSEEPAFDSGLQCAQPEVNIGEKMDGMTVWPPKIE